jgi:plasmid stability protein
MTTMTIRGLDEETRRRLRVRASSKGRSMEAEVREILRQAVQADDSGPGLGTRIHAMFADLDTNDFKVPERNDVARSVDFDA